MKYTINLTNFNGVSLRLQKNGQWIKNISPQELTENDYTTDNVNDLLSKINYDKIIYYGNEEFRTERDIREDSFRVTTLGETSTLYFEYYLFREDNLLFPTIDQLKQIMIQGNDSINNTLILNVDGKFELIKTDNYYDLVLEPNVVIRFESFMAGNGYVGHKLINENESYFERFFNVSKEKWDELKFNKKLNSLVDNF